MNENHSRYLYLSFSAVQGGISGNIAIGASAIVVSRQSKGLMEGDNFQNLTYTSRSTQGGNAMCKSFCNGNVIRVFRSSGLLNPFRTLQDHSEVQRGKTTMYRYDGLYRIEHVWETEHLQNGNERNDCPTPTKPAKGAQLYTFFLKRVGTLPRIDETLDSCNKMNDEEFCTHSKDIGTMCPLAKNEKAKILPLIWLNNLLVVPDSYIAHKLSSENVSNQCEESARNLVDSDHSMSTGQPVFASSLLCSSMEVKDQHSSEPRIVSLVNDSFKMSHIGGNEKEPRNQNKGPLFSKIWHTCHQQFSCFNHWFALCGHDNHSANVAHSPTRLKNIHQEARPMQSGIPVTNQDEESRKQETLNFTFAAHLLSTKESARKRNFPALLEKDWSNAPGKPKRRKENDFLDSCGSGLEPEEAEAQGKREIEDPTASEDQLQELELAHIGYEEEKSEIDIDCESLQSDAEASAAVAQAGQTQIVECNELPLGKNKSPGSPLSIKAKHEGLKSTDIKDDPLKHESLFEEGDHIGKHEVQSKLDFEHCGDADIEGDNVESQQFKQTTPTIKDKAKCPGDQVAEPQSQSLPDQAISLGDESGPVKTKKRKQAPSPIKEEKENSKEFPTLHEKRIRMPRLSSNSTPRRRSQGNLRPRASTLLETVDEKPRSIPRCKPKPGTKRIFKGVDELPKLYTSMFHAIGFAIWGKARRYCPAMIVSPFDLHKNGEPQTKWIEMYQKVEAKGSTEELKYLVHFPGSKTYDLVHPTDFVGYDKGLEKAKRNIKTQENAKGLKILEEDSKKLPHQRTHYSLESP